MDSYLKKVEYINAAFKDWGDIVIKEIPIGRGEKMTIVYIDDLVDRDMLEGSILKGLMIDIKLTGFDDENYSLEGYIKRGILSADYKDAQDIQDGINEVMAGNTLLVFQGREKGIVISSKGFPSRGVNKPDTEASVQGPQDAFSESLRINTVLIRRRIRDTSLKCKQMKVGRRSKTDIAVMYMDSIAKNEVVMELIRRLRNIDADMIVDSGYIEQYIEENKWTPFPQMQLTERPDKVAAELAEGRVAIVVDNTPFVILVPVVLSSFYQAADDYYQRWEISSFVRLIRFAAGFLAFALPGLYIAITVYNPSMLPVNLTLRLAGARESVPIPTVMEIVIMELAFEALREAGIRLPSVIGSTLGIVGGIIVGQAAVDAGLVSPMVVIVISLTGICSFAIPNLSLVAAFRLIKYLVIIASAAAGMFGFIMSVIVVLIHLIKLKSFGIPYLYPLGGMDSNIREDFKDTVLRLPLSEMKRRPAFADPKNRKRMK